MADEQHWPPHIREALMPLTFCGPTESEELLNSFVDHWGGLDREHLLLALREPELRAPVEQDERLLAIFALGQEATPPVHDLLLSLLSSPQPPERWASAICLGKLGERQALPVLGALLVESLPAALPALDDAGTSTGTGTGSRIVDTEPPYGSLRYSGLTVLEALGDPAAVPALRAALVRLIALLEQETMPEEEVAFLRDLSLELGDGRLEELTRLKMALDVSKRESVRYAHLEPAPRHLMDDLESADPPDPSDPTDPTDPLDPADLPEPPDPLDLLDSVTLPQPLDLQDQPDPVAERNAAIRWQLIVLSDLIDFEDRLIYTLGRLGALGVFSGLQVAEPLLHVWLVHLLMGYWHDDLSMQDFSRREPDPSLVARLKGHLEQYFGLMPPEQERALHFWWWLKRGLVSVRYSFEEIRARLETSGV